MEVVAKSLTQELPRFHPVVAVVAVAVAVVAVAVAVAEAVVAEAVGARVVAEPETGTAAKTTTTRRTRRNAKVIPLL
jgi:ABC-type protease/lipase transport system fused ATPase/permease subunit